MMYNNKSMLLGILAIAGMLVACNREVVDVNPNFDPDKNEVNTQFILSVNTGQAPQTRMTADAVQKNNNFYGITDAKIYAYATELAYPYVNNTTGEGYKKTYDLGTLYSNGDIVATQNLESSSNRILQLSIPVGTDAMLFYGKAISTQPGKVRGSMKSHLADTPSEIYFHVNRRIGDEDNVKKYDATARLMIYAINQIINTAVEAGSITGFPDLPALSWPELGHQYEYNNNLYGRREDPGMSERALYPLEESLGMTWSTFTHINTGEFRAGYSSAVKKMMIDMYAVINTASQSTPTSAPEANAKRLASQIAIQMNRFFDQNWVYRDVDEIKNILVPAAISQAQWDNATTGFAGAMDLNNYPYGDFGIPDGAAQLTFDHATDLFSYMHPNQALVTPDAYFEPRKYVYPAELAYFVNSGLRVTDKANIAVSDYPNGVNPWDDDTSTGNKWTAGNWQLNKPVISTTRGVAIRDNINYGVALLETNVDWTAAAKSAGAVDDNKAAMTGDGSDNSINLADTHFALHGILIGGAHPRVDWQYLPMSVNGINGLDGNPLGIFDGVVYDDDIANTSVPTQSPNYTLVFDNYDWRKGDSEQQNDVLVALEFVNNGSDFWGRDNMIPAGGTFYLAGKLVAAPTKKVNGEDLAQTITWPAHYQVPPIYGVDGPAPTGKTAGMSKQIPRVFIQDFMTKVTFRIGINSLKNAYVTVPDLRSSQMSLGLSVDIQWQNGFEYDIEF